jgi:hypothetical protein
MANIATNVFYASSMVEEDLDVIDKFLTENFDCWIERGDECIDAEFESRWDFPEELMDKLASQLKQPQEMYMRCLSHCLEDKYAALFIFSDGKWHLKD